jgi:hypothetical protein
MYLDLTPAGKSMRPLCAMRRPTQAGFGYHWAVLASDSRLSFSNTSALTIVELNPEGLRVRVYDSDPAWCEIIKVSDVRSATRRLSHLLECPPIYDLLSSNCETFARFVAVGEPKSEQIQSVGTIFAIGLALYVVRQ